jgi:1-acyl-sn-glycerol-3-phosphate acyltransferase
MAVEYYHLPVVWRFFRMIDCIPVDRESADPAAVRSALGHLQAGKVLGIFPEGGVPYPGEVRRARPGVGMLALRSGAVVIPAYISGTRYSSRVAPPFFHRHRARVRFGGPVDLSRFQQMPDRRAAYQAAADCIMQAIRQLAGLPDDAPFRPAERVGPNDQ